MTRRGMALVELMVGAAIGLAALGATLALMTLYRKPSDQRERVREASVALSLGLERFVRAVRDSAAIEEAAGPTLLLRTPEGTLDLFVFHPPAGGRRGELVFIEDAVRPGGAAAVSEATLAVDLTRAGFIASPAIAPLAGPGLLPLPEPTVVGCYLETTVGGEVVRAASAASCRNGSWGGLWR